MRDHLLSVCAWGRVGRAVLWLQANKANRGGGSVLGGGGGRCGLTLSRHETQIFRSGTPHETPGQLWRTSAEYGLINQRKLGGVGGSCRGQKDTHRGVKWECCKDPYDFVLFETQRGHCDQWHYKKMKKTRTLYQFMNTTFVSTGL